MAAVWVDPDDKVWLSDNVRQMLGRKGETWIAESGTERIRVIRHAAKD
jgi:virginiamycin B lyase